MLRMEDNENIKGFSGKMMGLVNQLRLLGKEITKERLVCKNRAKAPKKAVVVEHADEVLFMATIGNKSLFSTLDKSFKSKVKIKDGNYLNILGVGTVDIETASGSTISMKNNCYLLNLANVTHLALCNKLDVSKVRHRRIGHVNYNTLTLMSSKNLVDGLLVILKLAKVRQICQFGKQTRKPFPKKSRQKATRKFELVHTDISGSMKIASLSGSKYYIIFINDYSRFCQIFFLKQKSEALSYFKKFNAVAENFLGQCVKTLRTDNGKKYTSVEFE
ncbi:Integrase [Theobroma cacao]|nr:Integrase [Theobroma cacao]